MAKKAQEETTEAPVVASRKAPDGFVEVSARGPQNWHLCEIDNAVQGILLARLYNPRGNSGKGKYFYRIELTHPCRAQRYMEKDDEEMTPVTLKAKDIVCVDEKKLLEELKELCEDGGRYEVWINPLGKKPTFDGQGEFWDFDLRKHVLSPPHRRTENRNDNIPF